MKLDLLPFPLIDHHPSLALHPVINPTPSPAFSCYFGHLEHKANSPVMSSCEHRLNGTWASPQRYAQHGLCAVGHAAALVREQVEVASVDLGTVEAETLDVGVGVTRAFRQLQALETFCSVILARAFHKRT